MVRFVVKFPGEQHGSGTAASCKLVEGPGGVAMQSESRHEILASVQKYISCVE